MVRGPKRRRSLRLRGYDYSQPGAYFVNICTKDNSPQFGEIRGHDMKLNERGSIVEKVWIEIPDHFTNVTLDDFIVMPNHVHGIVIISDVGVIHAGAIHELPRQRDPKYKNATQQDALERNSPIARRRMTLPMVIGYYKMNTAKAINIANDSRGKPVWQRNYYEHIIRNEDALNRIRRYIQENPIKWPTDLENLNRTNLG